jgi:hypothetical protein
VTAVLPFLIHAHMLMTTVVRGRYLSTGRHDLARRGRLRTCSNNWARQCVTIG